MSKFDMALAYANFLHSLQKLKVISKEEVNLLFNNLANKFW